MNRLSFDNLEDRLLGGCLRRQAEKIPDDDFLVVDTEHYSYGRVNELANSAAHRLGGNASTNPGEGLFPVPYI